MAAPLAGGEGAARAARALAWAAQADARWQLFHSRHEAFFRPRQFVLAAFPQLAAAQRVLELGCGNGSSVYTLLRKGAPGSRVYASDLVPGALRNVAAAPEYAEAAASGRLQLFLYDAVRGEVPPEAIQRRLSPDRRAGAAAAPLPPPPPPPPAAAGRAGTRPLPALPVAPYPPEWRRVPEDVAAGRMDAVLLTFLASAVHPEQHAALVRRAAAALRPGGVLLFRDYGLYDLAQLRALPERMLTRQLHVRADGSLAHFFSVEEVRGLLEGGAGLEVLEARYACVRNVNRAKGLQMDRVWVHAVARKPPAA